LYEVVDSDVVFCSRTNSFWLRRCGRSKLFNGITLIP